jgi:hypothetical protein
VRNTYQRSASKSKGKFEVMGGRQLAVRLPLVEVWQELQPAVEHLTGLAGLRILGAVIEDEVRRRVGPRHRPDPASNYVRWGQQPGYVVFGGQKVAELGKIFRQLEHINPSVARSLEEGLEETLTVHRLGVDTLLRQTLASSNPIESCFSIVEKVARNVKRWRVGNHALRWTATGLFEAEKKSRKVKGYRELEILQRKLNPSLTHRSRWHKVPEVESLHFQLNQGRFSVTFSRCCKGVTDYGAKTDEVLEEVAVND